MRPAVVLLLFAAACRPPGYGEEDPTPDAAPDASGGGSATADAAVDSAQAMVCDHAFRLDGHTTATSVWLTGNFVSWAGNPGAGAIAFVQGVDGAWTGSYVFQPGTHQYKYIVSGSNWITDPTNPNTQNDGNGNINSVYTCAP